MGIDIKFSPKKCMSKTNLRQQKSYCWLSGKERVPGTGPEGISGDKMFSVLKGQMFHQHIHIYWSNRRSLHYTVWIYTWSLNNTSFEGVGPLVGGYFNKYVLRYWTAVIGWIHACGISDTPLNVQLKVAQLCLTLCNPMDYTVHGILQARILEWVG